MEITKYQKRKKWISGTSKLDSFECHFSTETSNDKGKMVRRACRGTNGLNLLLHKFVEVCGVEKCLYNKQQLKNYYYSSLGSMGSIIVKLPLSLGTNKFCWQNHHP